MTDKKPKPPNPSKNDRRAAALRKNLRRRKDVKRAGDSTPPNDKGSG